MILLVLVELSLNKAEFGSIALVKVDMTEFGGSWSS